MWPVTCASRCGVSTRGCRKGWSSSWCLIDVGAIDAWRRLDAQALADDAGRLNWLGALLLRV